MTVGGETFSLKEQAAADIARYDALKEVERLERLVTALPRTEGYALWLTNDRTFWNPPQSTSINDPALRIHEGRTLTGELRWSPAAGPGTTEGRERSLLLRGSYIIRWHDYSTVGSGPHGRFRYALVRDGHKAQPPSRVAAPGTQRMCHSSRWRRVLHRP